jgi:hypothetical protein
MDTFISHVSYMCAGRPTSATPSCDHLCMTTSRDEHPIHLPRAVCPQMNPLIPQAHRNRLNGFTDQCVEAQSQPSKKA